MEIKVEFHYDHVVGAVYEVVIERQKEKSVDDSLELLKMGFCLCPAYVVENLVRYFLDDLLSVVMRTSIASLKRESPTRIATPNR